MRRFIQAAVLAIALALPSFAHAKIVFLPATGSNITSNPTVNTPPGTVNGDILLAYVWEFGNPSPLTPPAGWNVLETNTLGQFETRLLSKVANNEPASAVWTSGAITSMNIIETGAHGDLGEVLSIDGTQFGQGNITATTITPPSLTASTAEEAAFTFVNGNSALGLDFATTQSQTNASVLAWQNVSQNITTNGGNFGSAFMQIQPNSGAITFPVIQGSVITQNRNWSCANILIKGGVRPAHDLRVRGPASFTSQTAANNATITIPGNTGDIVHLVGVVAAGQAFNTPTGFTQIIDTGTLSASLRGYVWCRSKQAGDTTVNVSTTGATQFTALATAYFDSRGGTLGCVSNATASQSASASSVVLPTITANAANDIIVGTGYIFDAGSAHLLEDIPASNISQGVIPAPPASNVITDDWVLAANQTPFSPGTMVNLDGALRATLGISTDITITIPAPGGITPNTGGIPTRGYGIFNGGIFNGM